MGLELDHGTGMKNSGFNRDEQVVAKRLPQKAEPTHVGACSGCAAAPLSFGTAVEYSGSPQGHNPCGHMKWGPLGQPPSVCLTGSRKRSVPPMNIPDRVRDSAESVLSAASETVSAGLPSGNGLMRKATVLRILLAATAGSFVASLKSNLERMGHIAIETSSPFETIACIGRRYPDLLITDLSFGGHDSGSIISVCRSTCPDCKIILSTNWARELIGLCPESYDVDFVLSSACRSEEVTGILNTILKTTGSGAYGS